jgi:hypothetical protein
MSFQNILSLYVRRPQLFFNGRQPLYFKLKTNLRLFQMEDDLIFFKWKTTPIFRVADSLYLPLSARPPVCPPTCSSYLYDDDIRCDSSTTLCRTGLIADDLDFFKWKTNAIFILENDLNIIRMEEVFIFFSCECNSRNCSCPSFLPSFRPSVLPSFLP